MNERIEFVAIILGVMSAIAFTAVLWFIYSITQ